MNSATGERAAKAVFPCSWTFDKEDTNRSSAVDSEPQRRVGKGAMQRLHDERERGGCKGRHRNSAKFEVAASGIHDTSKTTDTCCEFRGSKACGPRRQKRQDSFVELIHSSTLSLFVKQSTHSRLMRTLHSQSEPRNRRSPAHVGFRPIHGPHLVAGAGAWIKETRKDFWGRRFHK